MVDVDDSTDVEYIKNLIDPILPSDIILLNSMYDLINYNWQRVNFDKIQFYCKLFRFSMSREQVAKDTELFTRIMQGAYMELACDLRKKKLTPCIICALRVGFRYH